MATEATPTKQRSAWPELPALETWQDTFETVHMWSQVVGKVRLVCSPWLNHSWGCVLYVTARGLTTSPIPHRGRLVEIEFDFVAHQLRIRASGGEERSFPLQPMSVADFYRRTMDVLRDLGMDIRILARPVEVMEAIPFEEDDVHASYDPEAVNRFWRALLQAHRVFTDFRAGFIGKASPVHFFWGGFDLAVTRFSGRPAPRHPGGIPNVADWVMEEAYSHELSSAGFWPGPGVGEASFYSYAYPEPEGFRAAAVEPEAAYFHEELGEFLLPYDAVAGAPDPDDVLLAFLQSTFAGAADLARWDREALESHGPLDASRRRRT